MDIGEPALLLLGELKQFPEEKPYNASKQFDTTRTTTDNIVSCPLTVQTLRQFQYEVTSAYEFQLIRAFLAKLSARPKQ